MTSVSSHHDFAAIFEKAFSKLHWNNIPNTDLKSICKKIYKVNFGLHPLKLFRAFVCFRREMFLLLPLDWFFFGKKSRLWLSSSTPHWLLSMYFFSNISTCSIVQPLKNSSTPTENTWIVSEYSCYWGLLFKHISMSNCSFIVHQHQWKLHGLIPSS